MTDPTKRFSSRVADYVRYRPSYPQAAIELLQQRCGLGPAAVVADIGSGTGILTQLLLAHAAAVIAVEPTRACAARRNMPWARTGVSAVLRARQKQPLLRLQGSTFS